MRFPAPGPDPQALQARRAVIVKADFHQCHRLHALHPAQIAAATGLQLGQVVTDDDFKDVSRHLGETGAFSNVAYTFQFNPEGIKLEVQVTDSEPFVPVRFENFVWLSDEELHEKLSARDPLFQGQLPVSGNLADQVSETLQALAIEHNLHGRVDYLRAGPQDGPVEAFEFSITGAPIITRKHQLQRRRPGGGAAARGCRPAAFPPGLLAQPPYPSS